MTPPDVVTRSEWLAARRQLLAREKELTHLRDAVNTERRQMPWVKIDKDYVFDTPVGRRSLSDLFAGRSQLIVKHFMMGPDWVRHHDRYDSSGYVDKTGRYRDTRANESCCASGQTTR